QTSSSSDEYASPAAQDSEELPGQTAGPAVGEQQSPDAATPRGGDQGNGSTYGTQEEAADSMGPESAWVLAEETAELRALRRLPVDDEQWARFETILDRAEAAIVEHLRLPNRGSRQTPPRREINPDNAAQIQALYRRNRRRAVRLIADGPSQLCPIDPGTLHDYYTRLWSPATVDTTLLRSRAPTNEEPDTCPFSHDEVAAKLRRCESTAPGEDRLTYHHWRQVDPDGRYLAAVFNVCLLYRRTPRSWKTTRTILIHKKGDREDPTNWRPIALGRTIAKLDAWTTPGQEVGSCAWGFLDYANAYGSVAHQALVDAVRGAGAGEAFTAIVEELYRANTTCVVAAAGTTEPINIGAGLRQGCPLSCLLFNMVVNPVIRAVQGGARQHNILAYADDLTLLAEDPATLQCRLNVVTALSDRLGLRLKPAKCRTLHLSGRHAVGTRPTTFTVGGRPGPGTGGLRGAPVPGATCGVQGTSGPDDGRRGHPSRQTAALLHAHPMAEAGCNQNVSVSSPQLCHAGGPCQQRKVVSLGRGASPADQEDPVRAGPSLKRVCVRERTCRHCRDPSCIGAQRHLPSGRGLQAPVVDRSGGPGASEGGARPGSVEVAAATGGDGGHQGLPLGRHGGRLPADCDPAAVCLDGGPQGLPSPLRRLGAVRPGRPHDLRGGHGVSGEPQQADQDPPGHPQPGPDRSLQDKPSQGKAMACVAADLANSHFMRSGRYTRFKEWRFIHRARLNLLPLKGTRTWVPAADKRCRRCGYGEETLPHVLCHCMRQSRAMTERHNAIVARLKKAALGRYTVIGENQQVGVPGLRPDLVLARGEEALVLDVCCPFENRMRAFQEARRIKEEKYAPFTATSPPAVPARLRRRHRRRLPRHVGSGQRSCLPQVVLQALPADNEQTMHK
ncbi:hypothetical protein MTO96_045976, partial [Rhipicephalus appendiculatus]